MSSPAEIANSPEPWVLVAGGFHDFGGMDKLNAALARHLIGEGRPVHLVGFRIDDRFRGSAAGVHIVRKIGGSFFLGRARLDRRGRAIAAEVRRRYPNARVVTNGIGCGWPDINWVHFVNHAWPPRASGGPRWLQLKSRFEAFATLRLEPRILPRTQLLIANSNRTRSDLIQYLQAPAERIVIVYPGLDREWLPATAEERVAALDWLGIDRLEPTIVFVGALGHDPRKGFDILWDAWCRLCARNDWRGTLIVAGGGRALPGWRRTIEESGFADRVRVLGFSTRVSEVLAAADLLVSPTRYEPYGMNVHEAIIRGVPAIVSARAGIAERFPQSLRSTLLVNPDDPDELVALLLDWSHHVDAFRERFEPLGAMLRAHSDDAMAREIVDAASDCNAEKVA